MSVEALPRVWWFPASSALPRPTPAALATYYGYDLDDQPRLDDVAPSAAWLRGYPAATAWALDREDEPPQRRLSPPDLNDLLGDEAAPQALTALAEDPSLQSRMRSYTGCYFDLGDRTVPTSTGATLLHLVSDQQWVRHWLVLVGGSHGRCPVLSTTLPLGFEVGDGGPDDEPIPDVVDLDGSCDLTLTADTVDEFLYRFWIENELAFRAGDEEALPVPFASYAASLGQR